MPKRLLLVMFLIPLVAWLTGCAHTPTRLYDMSGIPKVQSQKKVSIAVRYERYTGHKYPGNVRFHESDMAETVANHLMASGIFPQVKTLKDWRESKGAYDVILVVTVVYYEGDKTKDMTVQNIGRWTRSLLLETIGAHGETLLRGYATLQVRIERASGEVVWQGEVKGRAEGTGKGKLMDIPLSPEIAAEALKDAMNNLVEKLKELDF